MSVQLLALRHGVTEWNLSHRLQGRRDEPLSEAARADLAAKCLPTRFSTWPWLSSPLARCTETAALLGARAVTSVPWLIEMDWGQWEGSSLPTQRRLDPEGMRRNEGAGLDFRAPGGESPREVRSRLAGSLNELAVGGESHIAVSHKGVLRALLSLAIDWDMKDKAPVKLDWTRAHLFEITAGGVRLAEPNIELVAREVQDGE